MLVLRNEKHVHTLHKPCMSYRLDHLHNETVSDHDSTKRLIKFHIAEQK